MIKLLQCYTKSHLEILHCVTSVQIRSYFWSLFSCIRTEYGDLGRSEYRKIRTRNNSVFGHFSRSVCVLELYILNCNCAYLSPINLLLFFRFKSLQQMTKFVTIKYYCKFENYLSDIALIFRK